MYRKQTTACHFSAPITSQHSQNESLWPYSIYQPHWFGFSSVLWSISFYDQPPSCPLSSNSLILLLVKWTCQASSCLKPLHLFFFPLAWNVPPQISLFLPYFFSSLQKLFHIHPQSYPNSIFYNPLFSFTYSLALYHIYICIYIYDLFIFLVSPFHARM